MKKSSTNPYSFLFGFVQNRQCGRVIAQIDELKDSGSTASTLLKWSRLENRWFSFRLDWHATRLCIKDNPEIELIAVGPDGIVSVGTSSGNHEEDIDATDKGPKRKGDIRDLRLIGTHVYVTGMSRQVYRREGSGNWTRQDNGMVQDPGTIKVSGFNAIDGVSEGDVFAVGFGGEIWRRQKNVWRKLDSPTNLVLYRVRTVNKNLAYACGQDGVLLRGNGDRWEPIPHSTVDEDLWGMEWYQDRLYVGCDSGIYILTEDDNLEKIDIGLSGKKTYRHLHQNDGVMLSVGPKHVLWTEDGHSWKDITP